MDPKNHKPIDPPNAPTVDMAGRVAELQKHAKNTGFTSQSNWEVDKRFMDDLWGEIDE